MARWSEPIVQGQEPEGMDLTDNDRQPPNSRVNPDRLGAVARPVHPVQHVQPVQPEQPVQSVQLAQPGFQPFVPCLNQIIGCNCKGIAALCKIVTRKNLQPILNRNSNA